MILSIQLWKAIPQKAGQASTELVVMDLLAAATSAGSLWSRQVAPWPLIVVHMHL